MRRFTRQRFWGLLILILACSAVLFFHFRWSSVLPKYEFLTGWALLGVMAVLAAYNVRKKFSFLPAASSESWLQVHIYLGYFTALLFFVHIGFHAPRGWFNQVLAILYGVVMVSGFLGLFLSRVLPKRLSARGGEVIFEQIPALRAALRQEAETLVFGGNLKSNTIAELYLRELSAFFAGPKNFWPHLVDSRIPLNTIVGEIDEVRPFVTEEERSAIEKLTDLVRRKDGLDYHRALQLTLKLWLFVHLPFTYGLALFSLAHLVVVFAFSEGAG